MPIRSLEMKAQTSESEIPTTAPHANIKTKAPQLGFSGRMVVATCMIAMLVVASIAVAKSLGGKFP